MRKRARSPDSAAMADGPALGDKFLHESLLCAWRDQLKLHRGTTPVWVDAALLQPGTLVAATTRHVLPRAAELFAGVELWAQRRPVTSPMHLHFDLDEERYRLEQVLRCPRRSCLLYMTDTGGPTLVLALEPGDPWRESVDCYACWPSQGQLFSFPGTWLHCVIAEAPAADAAASVAVGGHSVDRTVAETKGQAEGQRMRETIVLNFWPAPPPVEVLSLSEADVPRAPALAPASPAMRSGCDRPGSGDAAAAASAVAASAARVAAETPPGETEEENERGGVAGDGTTCADDGAWRWHTLTVGLIDGMATVELYLPASISTGAKALPGATAPRLRRFTARVRNTPDAAKIGPFYSG